MTKKAASRSGARPTRRTRTTPGPWVRLRTAVVTHLGRQADDLWGVILIVGGVLAALGIYADLAGPAGRAVDDGAGALFGWGRLLVPVALWVVGGLLVDGRARLAPAPDKPPPAWRNEASPAVVSVGFALLLVAVSGALHLGRGSPAWSSGAKGLRDAGGYVGCGLAQPLRSLFGGWGAAVVLLALGGVAVLIVTRTSVRSAAVQVGGAASGLARTLTSLVRWLGRTGRGDEIEATAERHPSAGPPDTAVFEAEVVPGDEAVEDAPPTAGRPDAAAEAGEVGPAGEDGVDGSRPAPEPVVGRQLSIDLGPAAEGGIWRLPPLQLLKGAKAQELDHRVLEARGRTLEDSLAAHGVETRLAGMTVGPTVTRYELELAPGVKVARVTSLQKDIAYAMAAPDIRLLAPIPGRSAIGVEVPNVVRQLVSLGDILATEDARKATHPLEVAVGRDIAGRPVMENLAAMPHLLIAGATGAGKSSCINSLLTSVLLRATPDQVRLILVDPKRVELGQYNGLPHLLTQVVVNPKRAANALAWAVHEMERRTDLLSEVGVRDIAGYNAAYDRGDLAAAGEGHQRLPFILVVVDELNDLMMVAARDVEESVCRIAQMGRAFGIHLVIATQRPSVDVITGVIKANIPSRLAFAVSSLADSRVILDQPGAERLVGKGDMLLLTASSNVPRRIQGPWVTEEEVRKVVGHWRRQSQPQYVEGVEGDDGGTKGAAPADEDDDDMLDAAMELVVRSQLGSTSMLQRKLRVGFSRAGRLMDLLERRGVVGPSEGSKARAVLMSVEELEERQGSTTPV